MARQSQPKLTRSQRRTLRPLITACFKRGLSREAAFAELLGHCSFMPTDYFDTAWAKLKAKPPVVHEPKRVSRRHGRIRSDVGVSAK